MTKTIIATVFAIGFATAAQAQGLQAPNIYAPSSGVGVGVGVYAAPVFSPPPWHPSISVPTYEIPQSSFRLRTCVPAAGDRC